MNSDIMVSKLSIIFGDDVTDTSKSDINNADRLNFYNSIINDKKIKIEKDNIVWVFYQYGYGIANMKVFPLIINSDVTTTRDILKIIDFIESEFIGSEFSGSDEYEIINNRVQLSNTTKAQYHHILSLLYQIYGHDEAVDRFKKILSDVDDYNSLLYKIR